MRSSILLVPLACLVIAADDDATKKEKAMLRGTWQAIAMDYWMEEKVPEEGIRKLSMVITDTKATIKDGPEERPGDYTIDSTKKEIDIAFTGGRHKGKTMKALYKLDGDTLSLCSGDQPGDPRPREFKVSKETRTLIITLKRVKP